MRVIIASLFFFAAQNSMAQNPNIWTIGITGGAGDVLESEFQGGVKDFATAATSLNVASEQSALLFGGDGRQSYLKNTAKSDHDIQVFKANFLKNPKECTNAQEIFDYMTSSAEHDVRSNENGNTLDSRITGEASMAKIKSFLDGVLQNATAGEDLVVNLDDHGWVEDRIGPSFWGVSLGEYPQSITTKDLAPYLAAFKSKGIHVHFNVQACFSGGFVDLSDVSESGAGTCVTAMADPRLEGYEADALVPRSYEQTFNKSFGKYGNQLQAFACGLGVDTWNRPMTSLDPIVKGWEKNGTSQDLLNCPATGLDLIKLAETTAQSLANAMTDPIRKGLLQSYHDLFIATLKDCSSESKDDDMVFRAELVACVDRSTIAPGYKTYLKRTLSSAVGNRYKKEMLNHHLNFIKNADTGSLLKFRNAYCCLAENLRLGKKPAVCDLK